MQSEQKLEDSEAQHEMALLEEKYQAALKEMQSEQKLEAAAWQAAWYHEKIQKKDE